MNYHKLKFYSTVNELLKVKIHLCVYFNIGVTQFKKVNNIVLARVLNSNFKRFYAILASGF